MLWTQDVEAALRRCDPRPTLDATLARARHGAIEVPPRLAAGGRADGAVIQVMLARDDERSLVLTKVVDYDPTRPRRDSRAASAGLLTLLRDGAPVLVCSADGFTALRTGLVAAATIDRLAPEGALAIALLGPGRVGTETLVALSRFRELTRCRVVGRDPDRTADAAERLAEMLPCPVEPVADVAAATLGATVLITATSAVTPVVSAADVAPGIAVIAALGAGIATRRELAAEVVASCDRIVVDTPDVAIDEAGDLLAAAEHGIEIQPRSLAEAGPAAVPGERVLYESVGSAWQDLACALVVLDELQPGWDAPTETTR